LQGYLHGFDGLKDKDDPKSRTSAHFLVGDSKLSSPLKEREIGIVQTQVPDTDGIPFLAAHVRGISYEKLLTNKQYFVRSFYQVGYQYPTFHTVLLDYYDGRLIEPNRHSIAIEITGSRYEDEGQFPSPQKLANVVSLVIALLKRYHIQATNLLGHHEIQMDKSDPGKQFLALIRFLVGVQALIDPDPELKELVFGPFLNASQNPEQAVRDYFEFYYAYHRLVTLPSKMYAWEALSQYWPFSELLPGAAPVVPVAKRFVPPVYGSYQTVGSGFLDPINHEGMDLDVAETIKSVQLIADGECLYTGEVRDAHHGKLLIFRHRQADGPRILSVYTHLEEMGSFQPGKIYPAQTRLGFFVKSRPPQESFMHFAIGYGATWESELEKVPVVRLTVGTEWIRERFMHPLDYLDNRMNHPNSQIGY
jgi:hypothetical protein